MKSSLLMNFSVDKEKGKVTVEREFAAPLSRVWSAWTESNLLDQWWAPKPWQAKTKSQEFKVGGTWLYAMVGPKGEEHWSRADYMAIDTQKSFSLKDAFCDATGKISDQMPGSSWTNTFTSKGDATFVKIEIQHRSPEDLEVLLKMGFKEGFTMGLENLDELLAK